MQLGWRNAQAGYLGGHGRIPGAEKDPRNSCGHSHPTPRLQALCAWDGEPSRSCKDSKQASSHPLTPQQPQGRATLRAPPPAP